MNYIRFLPAVVLLGMVCAAAAQEEADKQRTEAIEEIVIAGHPLSAEGLATPADVLPQQELERKAADSIGATVAGEPGIHNSSFGVAAGRPVIRGLGALACG